MGRGGKQDTFFRWRDPECKKYFSGPWASPMLEAESEPRSTDAHTSPTGLPSTLSSLTRNAGLLNVYSAVQGRYSSQCIPINQGACLHGRTDVPSLWLETEALLEELSSNPILNFSLFLSAPLPPPPHTFGDTDLWYSSNLPRI